jgi:Flp pilus assembly protein TadD
MTSAQGHDRPPEHVGGLTTEEAGPLLVQAAACAERGEIGQAERLIRQVLARDPRHPGALFELGRIANLKGDKRAAADCLQKAIASQPDNGKFHSELGVVWIGLGDRQQALRAFERALAIDPAEPTPSAIWARFISAKAGSTRLWRRIGGRSRSIPSI